MIRLVRSVLTCTFLALLLVVLPGCTRQSGPQLYKVTGTVTFDGEPVDGTIALLPVDGTGGSFGGEIQNGHYELESSPGDKKVVISGFRLSEAPKDLGPDGKPGNVQYLPKRYNLETTLTMHVKNADATQQDFPLESKSPAKP